MKYGQIAGSSSINAFIYRCFAYICQEDKQKFVKRFREQFPDSDEIMHTFRELVLGAYLCSRGFKARYEYPINSRTPDWSILDNDLRPNAIVELTNFHVDKLTEIKIEEQLRANGLACVWRDANKNNVDRLYYSIRHKAQAYRDLIQELKVPYIVAVFGEFRAAVDEEEIHICLFDRESGLFAMYPEVSGVLYFEEKSGRYLFRYIHNPTAQFDLLSGVFPSDAAYPLAPDDSNSLPR
ncbi:MAG TPA: hypothetical protein PLJ78_15430 [Anaerolineae bacterium]|nr:hypothetical protein [Anaerolineae bacterium]HQK15324.1 hypothetical protein [Anaerolineae bacterium]